MKGSRITDLPHFLDEEGTTSKVPSSAARLADYFGNIVKAVTSRAGSSNSVTATGIRCRRRPGHRRCTGEIVAFVDQKALSIIWQCPVCGDNGIISGWQDTMWDLGYMVSSSS